MDIEIIRQKAAWNKPKSKEIVFKFLEDMIDRITIDEHDIYIKQAISEVYNYFIPRTKAGKAAQKDNFAWVNLARKTKDEHYAGVLSLKYVCAENNRLIASDGQRLHWTATDLPDGFYDTAKMRIDDVSNFPDCQPIIESALEGAVWRYPVKLSELCIELGKDNKRYATIRCEDGTNMHVNYDYLAQAMGDDECQVFASSDNRPLAIRRGERQAILTPVNWKAVNK